MCFVHMINPEKDRKEFKCIPIELFGNVLRKNALPFAHIQGTIVFVSSLVN
jgi:hypothetical protein